MKRKFNDLFGIEIIETGIVTFINAFTVTFEQVNVSVTLCGEIVLRLTQCSFINQTPCSFIKLRNRV